MDRRRFLRRGSALVAGSLVDFPIANASPWIPSPLNVNTLRRSHILPVTDGHYLRTCGYVEDVPLEAYTWGPDQSYEQFEDMKFGIRVHWGLYSIPEWQGESWPFLSASFQQRQDYQQLYRAWNPTGFDADEWTQLFQDSGARMFSFTAKHHDGFSMYATKTKVRQRVNWLHDGGPRIEDCDFSYSIMDTPFGRDVVRELLEAARKRNLKADIYFSHPDWYDADFRPYTFHPLQVPGAASLSVTGKEKKPLLENPASRFGKSGMVIVDTADRPAIERMMKRHREQLEELITQYGEVSMICLDMFLGPEVWPFLRDTLLHLRKLRPDIMYRARGIGNYGDYYTPEGFVPGSKENTDVPWFVIYPLGSSFSYDPDKEKYKGAEWIIRQLVDAVAKGGSFMAGIGADGHGRFHPEAIRQLKLVGEWLAINGEGIYATRARPGNQWKEQNVFFTQHKNEKTLYAYCFEWPGEKMALTSVQPAKQSKIYLFGYEKPLTWHWDRATGLIIDLPGDQAKKSNSPIGCYGFKIEAV